MHTEIETPESRAAQAIRGAVAAGKQALAAGDLAAALEHFETVVESAPRNGDAWGNLAAVYAAMGAAGRAEVCYGRILDQDPHHADALYNRGVVRLLGGRFDAAHDDFAAVTALLPEDRDARNNLAVTAFMRGHLDEARTELRRLLDADPTHADAVLNLCDVELATGDLDAAVAACEACLAHGDQPDVDRRRFDLRAEATRRALATARDLRQAQAEG